MSKTNLRIGAIVVGAGKSRRMQTDKIILSLSGKPVLSWSIDTLQKNKTINQIVIVLNESNIAIGNKLVSENNWHKVSNICLGGTRRQDSVKNGLWKLNDCDWVIIHDAARPFISDTLIKTGIETAQETGAAIAAVPVNDTIKATDDNLIVSKTPNRNNLWIVQTPQIFRFDIITQAYSLVNTDVTDDASLVELAGYKVKIYMGSYSNLKITTQQDLLLADLIAKRY